MELLISEKEMKTKKWTVNYITRCVLICEADGFSDNIFNQFFFLLHGIAAMSFIQINAILYYRLKKNVI